MNRPPTYLCPTHSSRQTQPQGCADCQREKRLAIYERRIRELETKIEYIETQLVVLETSDIADTPEIEA